MDEEDAFKHRLRRGYIGIQNIGGSRTSFKDIQIRTLPDKEQWTDVFEEGLEGLTLTGNSKWTFEDKTLSARGNNAMAFTKKEYSTPFEFQVWVKTMVNGNGGVTIHASKEGRGKEVQCFNVPDSTNPTGSLYGIVSADRLLSRDNEWFLLQIFNDGPKASVYVNGEKVAETEKLKPPYKGRFGFQQHTPNGEIQYRGARVKMQ